MKPFLWGPKRKVNCTNLLKVLGDSEYMDMFLAKFEAIKYLMQTQGQV